MSLRVRIIIYVQLDKSRVEKEFSAARSQCRRVPDCVRYVCCPACSRN